MVDIHFWFRCKLAWSKRGLKLFTCPNLWGSHVSCCRALLENQTSCSRQTPPARITGHRVSSAITSPTLESKKLCFWARKLLLRKQTGAAKSNWENSVCCLGFPHLKRSLGWVQGSKGWFSPWTEPLLLFYIIARKGLSSRGELNYNCLHRSLLRKKVWGVCFIRSFYFLPAADWQGWESPVTVSPSQACFENTLPSWDEE